MKISIIIPVYNAEKYLDECISSACNQTYKDLEIILVDDGSTDNSLALCKKWALEDKRIVLIHKENAGVSAARNSGLEIATGDYITFLDSDDCLELEIVENSVDFIRNNGEIPCLYKFGYKKINGDQTSSGPKLWCDGISQAEMLAYAIYPNNRKYELGNYFRTVWGSFFDGDIVRDKKILFPEELYIGEDAIFIMRYLQYVQTARVICNDGYCYRMVGTSAVHRYKADLYEQSLRQSELITELIRLFGLENDVNIRQSVALFKWRSFTVLSRNGKNGYSKGKLAKQDSAKDAKKWYTDNRDELRSPVLASAAMPGRTMLQYYASRLCLPMEVLCWLAAL